MAKKGVPVNSERLYYANLAIIAEQAGNYSDAVGHWRRASGASSERANIILYEEAAMRCERRAKESAGD
jgi:hypothetical protein